ncbi:MULTISPECIES: hypothetical protein [Flammeovirga]|uniref:Uncharacterized protein n=1 Tax=Flammeovirga agarivorans TaxID=2726742 RepID=A0A7X8XXZ3_9BACT|nr:MULTISPECIES: hypothetical protein [Flammeovirga]NLR93724.1 hypothetical protein [Flammeovirga agarivorans]
MKRIIISLFYLFMLSTLITSCSEEEDNKVEVLNPEIIADVTTVDFGDLDVEEISEVKTIAISAFDLSESVMIEIPENFEASLIEDADFVAEELEISLDLLEGANANVYVRAVPPAGFQGNLSGDLALKSTGAQDVKIGLVAKVAIEIQGTLFMSEYFEQYTGYSNVMPLDSGIMGWDLNTDTVVNAANSGAGYPETTVPNNEVMNVWYLPIPLNGATLRASVGLSDDSNLAFSGYPSVDGHRNMVIDNDGSWHFWNWLNKKNGNCIAGKNEGNNTSASRRFAADGYTDDVFMSALIQVDELGTARTADEFGIGDIIALSNATSGSANNNVIKVVAISDDKGGFKFGIIKENEGNPYVLSEESYVLGKTYAVVLSHEFVEGDNNDVSKLYVFAEGDEIPTSMSDLEPKAVIDADYNGGLGVDPTDLTNIFIRERTQTVNTPTASITGIRVGDTWLATLFQEHSAAQNSNDLSLNNRVLTNSGSDCSLQ